MAHLNSAFALRTPAPLYRVECLEPTGRWDGMGNGSVETFSRLRDAKAALEAEYGYRYYANDRQVRIAKWDGYQWLPTK